jgi:hypothetical protein
MNMITGEGGYSCYNLELFRGGCHSRKNYPGITHTIGKQDMVPYPDSFPSSFLCCACKLDNDLRIAKLPERDDFNTIIHRSSLVLFFINFSLFRSAALGKCPLQEMELPQYLLMHYTVFLRYLFIRQMSSLYALMFDVYLSRSALRNLRILRANLWEIRWDEHEIYVVKIVKRDEKTYRL